MNIELHTLRVAPLLAGVLIALSAISAAAATGAPPIAEFAVPTSNSAPSGITAGPDDNLWFTEEAANKIGRIAPDGSITEFSRTNPGSQPTGIAAGPDGSVWFTVLSPACIGLPIGCAPTEPPWIGRITPTGTITEFPL